MLLFNEGTAEMSFSSDDLKNAVQRMLDKLGVRKKVLIIPPDFTRMHSRAGEITRYVYDYYGDAVTDILPALGTHFAMTAEEIEIMFGPTVPKDLFRVHDWRNDVTTVGEVHASMVKSISGGAVNYAWPAQVNRLIVEGNFDLILSIGQVVPHEVIGMANYNKNIFVGTGGTEGINKSHFLGAAFGMEKIMGRADTPVRQVLNFASDNFTAHLPIVYIQTVLSRADDGSLAIRGLFAGDDIECFYKASELSLAVNFEMFDRPIKKAVVFLDEAEYKSTWLGNKSVYRTRMALADGGELLILAPGLREFGEDNQIDALIRKYGYYGTPATLDAVRDNEDLRNNLSAAAHLIHGSSEGRFSVTYCPGHLSEAEIVGVGFQYASLDEMIKRYDPGSLRDGFNTLDDGEEIFYISNPSTGLWAARDRFEA